MLARFLTFVGHVALRQMIHLDVNILGEIKRRQGIQENEKDKHRQAKKAGRGKDNTGVSASKVCYAYRAALTYAFGVSSVCQL